MSTFKGRFDGFLKALNKSSITLKPENIFLTNNATGKEIEEVFRKIERMDSKPTAICAATDAIAISLLDSYISAGYRVPEDS